MTDMPLVKAIFTTITAVTAIVGYFLGEKSDQSGSLQSKVLHGLKWLGIGAGFAVCCIVGMMVLWFIV